MKRTQSERTTRPAAEFIAHRGCSWDAPENTLPAIRLAWRRRVDAVEIDIQLTADGRIVAMHDLNIERYTGRDRPTADCKLSELETLDFGAWKDERWRGTKIAVLEDILPLIPADRRMFVEIKCGREIVPGLKRTIDAADIAPSQAAFICFDRAVLAEVKRCLPRHRAYLLAGLTDPGASGNQDAALLALAEAAREADLDGIDLHAADLTAEAVDAVRGSGTQVYFWTCNDPDEAAELIRLGFDGITSDRPAWLRKQLPTS